jgi:predicted DNA-binding transcriptional regulator AlpA
LAFDNGRAGRDHEVRGGPRSPQLELKDMNCGPEYEFLLVVDGITVDDERSVAIIMDRFDGLMSWHRGVHRLAVSSEGAHAIDALLRLLARLDAELPSLRVLRLDPDLVGVPDIAERTGRSRQNVQQWIHGERNADRPFPLPEGSSGRSPIWRWAEINAWLAPLRLDDQVMRPTREESAVIDVALMQRGQVLVEGQEVTHLIGLAARNPTARPTILRQAGRALTAP